MFIDRVKLELRAGKGGDGAIRWRREKFVPNGGPAGGDGGDGGSIYLEADPSINTLLLYKDRRLFKAQPGEDGKSKKMFGKSGEDLILKVPLGTLVREAESSLPIADLHEPGQKFLVVKGGKGGLGNVHFRNAIRQAPRFAIPGGRGQELTVILELKLLADVGLVGFPNGGKSTILSVLSNAKPKIANYPFTTLEPQLGIVDLGDGNSYALADIPGLIEGAHEGTGLGQDFLRHIERTRILVQVIDLSAFEGRDPFEDFQIIQNELLSYKEGLEKKVKIIAANKMDLPDAENHLAEFKKKLGKTDLVIIPLSAATGKGIKALRYAIGEELSKVPKKTQSFNEELVDHQQFFKKDPSIHIYRKDHVIYAQGEPLKDLSRKLIIQDEDSVTFFEKRLEEMGVMDRIRELKPGEEDTINIEGFEFDWL